jgi:hypothetical protein
VYWVIAEAVVALFTGAKNVIHILPLKSGGRIDLFFAKFE